MFESERADDALSRRRAEAIGAELWAALSGPTELAGRVRVAGTRDWRSLLPSVYDVTATAVAAVGTALLAVAELGAARAGTPMPAVEVDPVAAAAAFRCEALQQPIGWQLPPVWDPIAGVYPTADGHIRLHTNYAHHRTAALAALELPAGVARPEVATRVAGRAGDELEAAVVEHGGCAAALRTPQQWGAHPHGRIAVGAAPLTLETEPDDARPRAASVARGGDPGGGPLAGVRVLDLTRVIAGPVATLTLAAWGAEVLRIDPPGFAEVPALLPAVTAGKRCAEIDLAKDAAVFAELVRRCDVIVHGLRPGALLRLGFGPAALRELNPAIVEVTHDAYGWAGPWSGRRGFDSLVQFSTGIGAETGDGAVPGVLPAQALDHATGHLIAAAACRGLTERLNGRRAAPRGSLVGVANLLMRQRLAGAPPPIDVARPQARRAVRATAWGELLAVPPPGVIGGRHPELPAPAGPLGRHPPQFTGARP